MKTEHDLEHPAFTQKKPYARHVVLAGIAALVTLAGTLVWSNAVKPDPNTQVMTQLLGQARIKTTTLQKQFSASELADIPQFGRANESFYRAQLLVLQDNAKAAIPHAQSSLALLDTTAESVYRRRFNTLKATVIEKQLAALDLPAGNLLTAEADNALLMAIKLYQENAINDALEQLRKANAVFEELHSGTTTDTRAAPASNK